MKKNEAPVSHLLQFLPPNTFGYVSAYLRKHPIHLTLTRERKTLLGDYRPPTRSHPSHRISVNANLNKYHFLITLLHEIAHLEAFLKYGMNHAPHGAEWKDAFREVLMPLLRRDAFPADIAQAVTRYLENPAASTCTCPHLYKALHRYNPRRRGYRMVGDLAENQKFVCDNGRVFRKLEQLRTRSRCRDLTNGKDYLFQGMVEVRVVED